MPNHAVPYSVAQADGQSSDLGRVAKDILLAAYPRPMSVRQADDRAEQPEIRVVENPGGHAEVVHDEAQCAGCELPPRVVGPLTRCRVTYQADGESPADYCADCLAIFDEAPGYVQATTDIQSIERIESTMAVAK